MLKRLILAASMLVCTLPAVADSWDSEKNINRAMDAALKTYKSKGVLALVAESQNCYAGLDSSRDNRNVGRDVEYCISYEFSAAMIDSEVCKAMSFPRNEYLSNPDAFVRAMYHLERARIVRLPEEFERYIVPRLTKITDELPRILAGDSASKSEASGKCVDKKMVKWEKQREKEVNKWCSDLAKKNQECRISAGQEEGVKQEALDKITAQCRS